MDELTSERDHQLSRAIELEIVYQHMYGTDSGAYALRLLASRLGMHIDSVFVDARIQRCITGMTVQEFQNWLEARRQRENR